MAEEKRVRPAVRGRERVEPLVRYIIADCKTENKRVGQINTARPRSTQRDQTASHLLLSFIHYEAGV